MNTHRIGEMQIISFTDSMHAAVLSFWKKSVLATQNFLYNTDFHKIKELVGKIKFHAFEVHCLMQKIPSSALWVLQKKLKCFFMDPIILAKNMN